ncbi:MAG: gluconate 2-dehydrogenase subunit 3 family protein [Kineosporiaceae bacterium]
MPFRSPAQRAVTPQNRGRFPGFDVLAQVDAWDDVTARVVLARLSHPTGLSFFTPAEVAIARPLLDLLLAQDGEPRVPVLELVDQRLAVGETDGWHYDDLPEDAVAWRDSLAALDEDARERCGHGFAELGTADRAALVQAVQDVDGQWHGVSAAHVWSLWTRYACTAFYSHPWAWNEIGFPGPAYPRGYLNLGVHAREKHEVADHVDADPVAAGRRTEQAREQHAAMLRGPS